VKSLFSILECSGEPGVVACGSSARVYVIVYKSNGIAISPFATEKLLDA
jgi:hypothetical protein